MSQQPRPALIWVVAVISILAVPVSSATARTVTFELNGVRFYMPEHWTITPHNPRPPYERKMPPPDGDIISADQFIRLSFPSAPDSSGWQQRYPEITPLFIYELSLTPGIRNLAALQADHPRAPDSHVAKAIAEQTPDEDGFIKVGPTRYISLRPNDVSATGVYLSYYCRTDLTPADRGIRSRCTVSDQFIDGIAVQYSWDGIQFSKSHWRQLHARVRALVIWLATHEHQRPAKFDQ